MSIEVLADSILTGAITLDKELPNGVKLANECAIRRGEGTHYIAYLTVNTTNGKYYVGQHQTRNPYDDYVGSGHYFLKALKKYGISSFIKYILADFCSFDEMNAAEKELVTLETCFPANRRSYNIKAGGNDGGHIAATLLRQSRRMSGRYVGDKNPMAGKNVKDYMTAEAYAEMRRKQKEHNKIAEVARKCWKDPVYRNAMRKRLSQLATGRVMSEECKRRISETLRARHTKWWTDGITQVRLAVCPPGFWLGRLGTPKDRPVKPKRVRIKQVRIRLGRVGIRWWTDGVVEKKSRTPIAGMRPGRLKASAETRAKMRASNRSSEVIARIMRDEREHFDEWHKRAIKIRQENYERSKVSKEVQE